jgi:nucleotide-binding universal stress UspA family protein
VYRRILVPLDGSDFADRVLPHAEALAEKFGATLILLHVATSPADLMTQAAVGPILGPETVVDPTSLVETERQEVAAYFETLAERLRGRGLAAEWEQIEGHAGRVIVERAGDHRADLVVMTTHGRGGLRRLVFGSVAEEVVRDAPCPVLLVRVSEAAPE